MQLARAAKAADDPSAPLHPRFERLIRLLLGRLAIVFKGHLQAGNKRLNLTGIYITEEQLKEIVY